MGSAGGIGALLRLLPPRLRPLLLVVAIVPALLAFAPDGERAGWVLSPPAMQHIMARHGPASRAENAGKFLPGTSEARIRALIAETIETGDRREDTRGRPATLYERSFPEPIGIDIDGRPTRRLRVVVAPDLAVITAYPR